MNDQHLADLSFRDLNLPDTILQGLDEAGFLRCTPIQAETLPIALAGKDVAGQAQTGTGKTAAFLLAVFNKLLANNEQPGKQPRAFILAPTRELAQQIYNDAILLGKHTGLRFTVCYGGTGYDQQRQQLEAGTDVLIGTPGRLIDYFKQHVFNLKQIECLVIDEADRMFDLGFIKDIRYLLRRMPPPQERLNMLFSATLSHRVMELTYEHMNKVTRVVIKSENVTADKITQTVYYPATDEKISLLLGLFETRHIERAVIFCNTKRNTELVTAYMEGNGRPTALLSGDVPQNKRLRLLQEFTDGKLMVMVATDVAARGLHIPEVSHVINFDLPNDAEDYVHRIGRTARAGESGEAISFACEEFAQALPEIEEYIGMKITTAKITPDLLATPKPPIFPKRDPNKKNFDRKKRPQNRSRHSGRSSSQNR